MINNNWQKEGLPYTCSDRQVTIIMPDGRPRSILRSDTDKFNKVMEAVRACDWRAVVNQIDLATNIETRSGGTFHVKEDYVYINNIRLPEALSRKIVSFAKENLPVEPLLRFWDNLNKNPSYRSVNQLYSFLEKNNHPITPDGCFIAYKKIRADYTDGRTGTFNNAIGATVEMPRNQVNEDPEQTCSNGLHVANFEYAKSFYGGNAAGTIGDRLVLVKVNPADVVAVPVDYNAAKMRVCKYVVISELEHELETRSLYNDGSQSELDKNEDEEEDEDYYDDDDEDYDGEYDDNGEYHDNDEDEYEDEDEDY